MDIAAKIQEIVGKVQSDPKLLESFQSNPSKAIKDLVGVDVPEEQLSAIVSGVQGKVAAASAGDLLGKVGGLFGKK